MKTSLNSLLVLSFVACGVFVEGWGSSRIVIEGNVIAHNGIGVYIGWGGEWDIILEANKILSNGEGIRLKNQRAVIIRNVISRNVVGLLVATEHQETAVVKAIEYIVVSLNAFEFNELYAIWNLSRFAIRADRNWWGDPKGPVFELGRINALAGPVEVSPWLTIPPF